MNTIEAALKQVRARMHAAARAAGRDPADVRLLAVSKTFGADAVRAAHAAGQRAFGENYVQEALGKIEATRGLAGIEWHCIGPLQSNKTRQVAEHFDWVHTVDRLKIAERLSAQRPTHLPPLQVCLQVNIDGGANKSGVAPADALALARDVAQLPRLALRGLMSIPEIAPDFIASRSLHQRVKELFDAILASEKDWLTHWDTLSMGMSADLEAAIAAGSTLVRVGTALFGARIAA
ncbi:MAG TPA: YggS family pyridoxal phosphate-dependent enzyme [Burkholderiaceae bacterium]|nr:YggS family pyridoxal phosphate-dependent enzyme [Burkholderiaceae bacterium]